MSLRVDTKSKVVPKFVVKMERALSIGWRRQCCVGKYAVYYAEQHEIVERLVGDPLRIRPERPEHRQIIVGETPRRLRGGGDAKSVLARRIA
jgi:hypothetical protein